jgi:proteasome lid subunit RPN8/RPN11
MVRLAGSVRGQLLSHARREAPRECCGLLLGTGDGICAAVPARNVLADATAYRIDPRDHFAAIRRARAGGLTVLGAYHSHPASAPVPSVRDRAEAWTDFLYVIVSLSAAAAAEPIRAWRLHDGNFVEVALVSPTEEHDAPCSPESPLQP